jgi:hypothetical protein
MYVKRFQDNVVQIDDLEKEISNFNNERNLQSILEIIKNRAVSGN